MIGKKLGPYEVLASIGSGGMGEVWKARDTRLGRIVAIKKVREQHSERFKQEARSIAALNHPNICQIHDIGEDYLVLEYVEGKPLLNPLPEQEAVRLAIQIATALEEAHQHGIIHRDLKPSNIMVTDKGTVKLLDFGLAKLYEQDQSISSLPTADYPATQAGAILGTMAYMSPEQAQGQPADARSDIFSFGLVLYEMLSGRKAFIGDSNLTLMEAIIRKEPPPLKASTDLERIVKRCLKKNPSDRYQTISEIKAALEKTVQSKAAESSEEPQPSIAVLPFVNMSGDKEQEYFSDGLAEEIINALSQIPGLLVIARTSAFAFKGKQEDITKIAEALRVSTILEGSVRKAGNRVRITAQLIDASRGSHLWSQRYDREMNDIFAIQDEIAQAIADKLRIRLTGGRSLVKHHTQNLEAFNLYLKGRYYLVRPAEEHIAKCREYFEQAIAMDPNYAKPWFGLAWLYFGMGLGGIMQSREANTQCGRAVHKALALDDMLPEAHSMLAALRAVEFDWKEAEREFHNALQLGPEISDVWWQYSQFYLVPQRRLDEAVTAARRALDLDPLSPFFHLQLALRHFSLGQYDRAMQQVRNALELDPNFYMAHFHLSMNLIQIGKLDEAVRSIETAAQSLGFAPMIRAGQAFVYSRAGRIDDARKVLDELQKLALQKNVPAIAFTISYLGLGEIDTSFDWLDKAADERDTLVLSIPFTPFFDALRSHSRYKALLRKMNLEP